MSEGNGMLDRIDQAFCLTIQMDGLVILLIIVVIIVVFVVVVWALWNQSNQNKASTQLDGIQQNLGAIEQLWNDSTYWTRILIIEKLHKSEGAAITHQRLSEIRTEIGRGYGILLGATHGQAIADSLIERDNRLVQAIDALDKERLSSLDNHDLNRLLIEALLPQLDHNLNSSEVTSHLNGLDNSFRQQISLLKQRQFDDAMKEFNVAADHAFQVSSSIGRAITNKAILLTQAKVN